MNLHCEVPRWHQLKLQLNNLEPVEFKEMLTKKQEAVLLDVRTQLEASEYRLEGSTVLDYLAPDFIDRLEALDKEGTYFVYCRTGRRSVRTCIMMHNSGIENIFHLEGGVEKWKEVFPSQKT